MRPCVNWAMSKRNTRINNQYGYILHASAWRETSLIIQAFTKNYGRVAMVAKGAKRPYSALRPVLTGFQPLWLSWSGAAEIHTLTKAETDKVLLLNGKAMMSAWYMNELILKLLPHEDPYPGVFDAYEQALIDLGAVNKSLGYASILRTFEWVLLEQIGYGMDTPMPDLKLADAEPSLRLQLRARIDQLLDNPLRTRQVMQDLQKY